MSNITLRRRSETTRHNSRAVQDENQTPNFLPRVKGKHRTLTPRRRFKTPVQVYGSKIQRLSPLAAGILTPRSTKVVDLRKMGTPNSAKNTNSINPALDKKKAAKLVIRLRSERDTYKSYCKTYQQNWLESKDKIVQYHKTTQAEFEKLRTENDKLRESYNIIVSFYFIWQKLALSQSESICMHQKRQLNVLKQQLKLQKSIVHKQQDLLKSNTKQVHKLLVSQHAEQFPSSGFMNKEVRNLEYSNRKISRVNNNKVSMLEKKMDTYLKNEMSKADERDAISRKLVFQIGSSQTAGFMTPMK